MRGRLSRVGIVLLVAISLGIAASVYLYVGQATERPDQQGELRKKPNEGNISAAGEAVQGDRQSQSFLSQLIPFLIGVTVGAAPLIFMLRRSSSRYKSLKEKGGGHEKKIVNKKNNSIREYKYKNENNIENLPERSRMVSQQTHRPTPPLSPPVGSRAEPPHQNDERSEYVSIDRRRADNVPSQISAPRGVDPVLLCHDFNRLLASQPSRDAFDKFFRTIMNVENAGAEGIDNDGEFLKIVVFRNETVVFPSFDFINMLDTIFTTLASVPDGVRELYDLERGDGEVVVERLAVLDANNRVKSRGMLRGFGG